MRKIVSRLFKFNLLNLLVSAAVFLHMSSGLCADAPTEFPNFIYDSEIMGIETFVLGRTCYSLRLSPMSLDCNPTFMAGREDDTLAFNLGLDNNTKRVWNLISDLENHDSITVANRLLKNQRPILAYEVASSWFQYDWWAVTFVPGRLGLASVVVNPAYPEVTAQAILEKEISLKGGLFVANDTNLRLGGNIRFIKRHELRQRFDLLNVIAGSDHLDIEENNIVYFEPSLTYEWNSAWRPQISAVLTQMRLYSSKKLNENIAVPEIGYSTSPDYLDGRFRTSLHYTARPDISRLSDRLRFGGIYDWSEVFSTNFSLAGDEYGAGVIGRIDSLVLGVGAKSQVLRMDGQEISKMNTVLFQAGLYF